MSLTKGPYLLDKDMAWKAERISGRMQRDRAVFRSRSLWPPHIRGPFPRSFWMMLLLQLPLAEKKKKKMFFLTKPPSPARLRPPVNTAVARSYNQNGIWKGNSSWQNEKHIPLNPALSSAHNGLRTPSLCSLWISTNSRVFLKGRISSWLKAQVPPHWSHSS